MSLDDCKLRISPAEVQQSVHDQEPHRSRLLTMRRVLWLLATVVFFAAARRRRKATLLALVFSLLVWVSPPGSADTLDPPGQFAVLGAGSAHCTSVIRAVGQMAPVRETDRQAMLAWAQGYLSFYNSVSEGTYDVTGGVGAAPLQEWLLEFCRQNPQASLMNAVDQLLVDGAPHPFLRSIKH